MSSLNHGPTFMRSRLFSLFFVLLLVVPPAAYAQEPDTTQLPEIAPREIEIRGERQIALPALERQPLTGFASPPSVPSVPADRQPFVGAYEQPLDELPESLPLPETVAQSMTPTAEPAQGFLEGSSGRYFRRVFEGRVGTPLSATERLSVHGKYSGTEANPNDDVAEARIRLESNQEDVRIEADAHGAVQRYALYGATARSGGAPDIPNREGSSVGASVQLQRTTPTFPARAGLRYEHAQYTSHLDANADGRRFAQQQVDLTGAATAPFPYRPHVNVQYRRSWLSGDPLDDTAFDLEANGTLSFFSTDSLSVEAGGTVLVYDTPATPNAPALGTAQATFIAPVLDAEWRLTEGTRLHLRNEPRLGDSSLDHLYSTNPYAWHAPSLRPTLETTNAEAGLTLTRGAVRIVAATGYRYAPTYRYFALAAQGDYRNLYRVHYGSARILQGRGEIALQGVDGVHASLGISVRDGLLTSSDTAIPNFAPLTANAILGLSFAEGDGFIEAQGQFKSPRDADTNQNVRVHSYFTVDVEGSYALGSDIELVARVGNLSTTAPTLWANYPRPPAQASLGLRLRW